MADEVKETEFKDNIEKNIDLAIEAQDGPVEAKAKETDETGKEQQPKAGESGASDTGSQQKSDEKGKEEEKPAASAGKDLTTNEGVVRAGAERRFYDQRNLARDQLETEKRTSQQLRNEIQQITTKLETQQQSIAEVHGVEPRTLALGVKIVTDMQRDPVGTLKKLLAEAAAQGYTVEDIGSGVDMAAISRMIDERLPKSDGNEQRSEQEIIQEARNEADSFFSSFPDAKPHDRLIASVLRDHPDLSLQDAYYQLKNAFIEKGFDWNLPLEENLKASGDLPNNGGDNNQQLDETGKPKPLPIGGNGLDADIKSADVIALAGAEEDTGDIVRAAMRESGFKV